MADGFDYGSDFDLGSFEDLASVDALNNIDLSNIDFGSNFDLGSFEDLAAVDALSGLDLNNIDFGSNFDLGSFEDMLAADALSGTDLASSIDLAKGADLGGLGLKATGRGQMSLVDPETGATGLTAEGFRNIQDLLGSGTAEEIARYTPGTADYSIRSGLETEGGQGLSADATRGMGLESMGGAQGLSRYIPAEYGGSALEDLIKSSPGQYGAIEDYINSEIYGGKGIDPFAGTGGTLSATGFLEQNSAANPLGAKYSIGDQKSFINRPSITGQQASVAPGRTVINNKDGTYTVVSEDKNGNLTRKTVDESGKPTTGGGTKTGTGAKTGGQQKSDLSSLLPLLLMLLAANRSGSSGASSAIIPALTATQKQTPYTQIQQAAGYRPGQGGITYFNPVQYAPRMAAGGGIASLDSGRLLDGPGDGVSDSIPAVIDGMAEGGQPARLARGEYVMDARTVAALGNGSTDAGAERLDEMRKKILATDRKAKVGADSKAYKHLNV